MRTRVGLGYDVHRFIEGRPLMLGGVEVPHTRGLEGHSDADVLTHAVCDALLGAAGLGDIGEHFPNTDERFRGIASLKLLKHVVDLIAAEGYRVINVDTMILAQEPNLKAHKPRMRTALAAVLGVEESAVNIKATTNEGMGFVGRAEGIAAHAAVLLGQ